MQELLIMKIFVSSRYFPLREQVKYCIGRIFHDTGTLSLDVGRDRKHRARGEALSRNNPSMEAKRKSGDIIQEDRWHFPKRRGDAVSVKSRVQSAWSSRFTACIGDYYASSWDAWSQWVPRTPKRNGRERMREETVTRSIVTAVVVQLPRWAVTMYPLSLCANNLMHCEHYPPSKARDRGRKDPRSIRYPPLRMHMSDICQSQTESPLKYLNHSIAYDCNLCSRG